MKICRSKGLIAVIFSISLVLSSTTCLASEESLYQRVDELMSRGESQQALAILQGLPRDGNRVEILWQMARAEYEIGRLAESGSRL